MLTNTTQTVYVVARGEEIISDGFLTVAKAEQQLAFISETMRTVNLTPDVHLVEVQVKTTLGKVKPYTPPAPAPDFEFEKPADDTTATGKGKPTSEASPETAQQTTDPDNPPAEAPTAP